jgi:rhodanese-related sulfurtransferase
MTDAVRPVDAATLKRWLERGDAVLVDIREPNEYAREHVLGARHVPLSGFDPGDFADDHDKIGVFHCASGRRTTAAAGQLKAAGFREVYCLQGGLLAWKAAGLPTHVNRRAPLSILRQVQLVAGLMALIGAILAISVSPWFILLSGVIGGGLMFAGASGYCPLASLLETMPWNRRLMRLAA